MSIRNTFQWPTVGFLSQMAGHELCIIEKDSAEELKNSVLSFKLKFLNILVAIWSAEKKFLAKDR